MADQPARASGPMVTLTLACGCKIEVEDDEMCPWEVGDGTICDIDAHGLVEVTEVPYG